MRLLIDKWLLLIVFVLILIGLVSVYSSTSVVTPDVLEKGQESGKQVSPFGFLKKQLFTLCVGIFALFLAYKIRLNHLKILTIPLLIISLICLLLVFTSLGVSAGGARRWIRAWPTVFQPSELVKLSIVIFMAWFLSSKYFNRDSIRSFFIPIGILVVFQLLLIKQRDFGAVMSLGVLTVTLLFIGGVRLKYICLLGLVSLPFIVKLALEPYRLKRITSFIDPWKDPLGSGFQLVQSFIALGSGGITGVGLGEGKQKLSYLPEIHTDFIFALIGEELGFVGTVVVILLFILFLMRGMWIAKNSHDSFSTYLAYGITFMISYQALINFLVVTGMIPTKGLPLPFISYGGSSLFVNMTAVGILLNVAKVNKQQRLLQTQSQPLTNKEHFQLYIPLTNNDVKDGVFIKPFYCFNRKTNTIV
ncbi:MAG: putative lipid II flippase FtsW [Thermodesulfovibrionales bacterium]|nr:putative lipid II flippase FtsW [Thermodesulfovibrionales bacterium]